MNKKVTLLASFITLILTLAMAITIGSVRDQALLRETNALFETRTSAYLSQMTEGLRNDLLQQNYRLVRNRLSSLQADALFSDFAIEQGGSIVEMSSQYEKHLKISEYLRTSVPIRFSHSSDEFWGRLHFLTSKHELRKLSSTLSKSLWLASLSLALFTVLAVGLLLLAFWSSGNFLSKYLRSVLEDNNIPKSKISIWIWSPLLQVFQDVVKNFKTASAELEASKLERELGTIAAHVAHDIRSPLSALRIVLQKQDRSSAADDLMKKAVDRIESIADDLLRYRRNRRLDELVATPSQKLAGQFPGKIELLKITDIAHFVRDSIEEKQLRFNSNAIEWQIHIDDSASVLLRIDPDAFRRIFSNLLENAIESLPDQRGRIEIGLNQTGGYLSLYIADSGRGIPKDILPLIMSKGATFGKSNGNGLGLYSAKMQIQAWGGRIYIGSLAARGTLVKIEMPFASEV